jgi:hypothetical protein
MASPTRYPNGVTNNRDTSPLGKLPILDPTKHVVFHDDFFAATLSAAGITGWHLDEVDTSTDSTALAVTDAHGGVATLSPGATANDNTNYQWGTNTTVHEIFKLESGKEAWLRVRFKTEDADQDAVYIGLHIAADDPQGTEPSDQFVFRSALATPAALQFACGKTNSTEVTISLGTLSDDTWSICTAYYDGKNTVYAWRESSPGVVVASGQATVTSSTTGDLLPDTEMTVGFGMEGIDTGADVLSLDYITVVTSR